MQSPQKSAAHTPHRYRRVWHDSRASRESFATVSVALRHEPPGGGAKGQELHRVSRSWSNNARGARPSESEPSRARNANRQRLWNRRDVGESPHPGHQSVGRLGDDRDVLGLGGGGGEERLRRRRRPQLVRFVLRLGERRSAKRRAALATATGAVDGPRSASPSSPPPSPRGHGTTGVRASGASGASSSSIIVYPVPNPLTITSSRLVARWRTVVARAVRHGPQSAVAHPRSHRPNHRPTTRAGRSPSGSGGSGTSGCSSRSKPHVTHVRISWGVSSRVSACGGRVSASGAVRCTTTSISGSGADALRGASSARRKSSASSPSSSIIASSRGTPWLACASPPSVSINTGSFATRHAGSFGDAVGDDARFRAARDGASGGRPARGEDPRGGVARALALGGTLGGAVVSGAGDARGTAPVRGIAGGRSGPSRGVSRSPAPGRGGRDAPGHVGASSRPRRGDAVPHVSHARIAGELRREHRAHDHVSEARAPRSEGSSRASLETARKRSGMVVRVLVGERGGSRARHPPGCTIHTGERARAGRGHAVRVPGAALLDARASLLARARFAPREGDVVLARERVRPNTGTPRFFARIATYGLARAYFLC